MSASEGSSQTLQQLDGAGVVTSATAAKYNLATAQATLEACTHDLAEESDRMKTIDGKLTQLAAFAGVSISISGGLGGSLLAGGHLPHGFAIALGALLATAAAFLLATVVVAFHALSPKSYRGIDEHAVEARTTEDALNREPADAIAVIAAGRRDMFLTAREVNNEKADATIVVFWCAAVGFALLVVALLVSAIGSVV